MASEEAKWAYLAALIDGEGCISISRRYQEGLKHTRTHKVRTTNNNPYMMFGFRVHITSTSEDLMLWLVKIYGGKFIGKDRKITNPKHKRRFEWRSGKGKETFHILTQIQPYIVIKPGQVGIGIEYLRMSLNGERDSLKRMQLYIFNRFLNSKGNLPPDIVLDKMMEVRKINFRNAA